MAREINASRAISVQILGFGLCLLAGLTSGWADTNRVASGTNAATVSATGFLSSVVLRPGFRLELVAEATLVEAPVALAFDEDGRLFVAEMRDYPNHLQETSHRGRIRLLEDTNGTGRFESSKVFADDLPCPSALACYNGGLFVGAGREILYLKDTTGTGTATVRQTVFSGFGSTNPPAPGLFLNNFNWGSDNLIHGATGGLGGVVTGASSGNSSLVSLAGSDFAFEPRSLTLLPEAGPAQSGLCFDSRGRRFLTDFARPLRLPMIEPRYANRNPYAPCSQTFIDVLSPATPVFRLAPTPAANVTTPGEFGTNRTSTAAFSLPKEVATWMTKACGTVVYQGSAFPSNYLENVFIADPAAHLIHRAILHQHGLEVSATRASDESTAEFLASSDPDFHPMQLVNGPDGALYIADFCRGEDTGRILRIVPEHFTRPEVPRMSKAQARECVIALAHTDGWRRGTAARLLYEHPDPAAVPLLGNMLAHSTLPLARREALRVLSSLGALQESHLLRALQDPDSRVREQAVHLCELPLRRGALTDALWDELSARTSDPSPTVRFQLALSLGETSDRSRLPLLAHLLMGDNAPWLRAAVLSCLAGSGSEMLVLLARAPQFATNRAQAELVEQLVTMVGVEGNIAQVNGLLQFLDSATLEPAISFALLSALGEGLHRTRSSLALVDPQGRLARFYVEAQRLTADRTEPEALRLQAIRFLGVSPLAFAEVSDLLLLRLGSGESPAIQAGVLATLARYDDPHIARALLARWDALPSALRPQAVSTLMAWTNRVPEVLDAVETGALRRDDLTCAALNCLRTYSEATLRQRAVQLLGPVAQYRPELVQRMQSALTLRGQPNRGHELFQARCAACHAFAGQGTPLGPNLAFAKVAGRERLLLAILEPNATQRPGYTPSTLQTKPGELLLGLVGGQNLNTLTLNQPLGAQLVWPRENIQLLQPQPWSLMPDNLTQGLSTQDLADLLDYLMTTP